MNWTTCLCPLCSSLKVFFFNGTLPNLQGCRVVDHDSIAHFQPCIDDSTTTNHWCACRHPFLRFQVCSMTFSCLLFFSNCKLLDMFSNITITGIEHFERKFFSFFVGMLEHNLLPWVGAHFLFCSLPLPGFPNSSLNFVSKPKLQGFVGWCTLRILRVDGRNPKQPPFGCMKPCK